MKTCVHCNAKFETDKFHPYTVYCSHKCRIKSHHEHTFKPMRKNCLVCKKQFHPRGPKKVCSKSCYKIRHKELSRKWNIEHWDAFYKDYMKNFHKKEWAEYKCKHNIDNRPFIKQKVLTNTILKILKNPEVQEEAKFDWLRSSSGVLMRTDAYFPSHNLIVEFDGEQHFFPICWKKQSRESAQLNFIKQRKRDILKEKLIRKQGIIFLRFSYKEPIENIDYVRDKLIANQIRC